MSTFTGVNLPPPKVERTLFLGHKIPLEVKELIKILPEIEKGVFRQILTALLSHVLESEELNHQRLHQLADASTSVEKLIRVFAGLDVIVRSALRQSGLKPEVFKEDLLELKMKPEVANDLMSALFGGKRPELERALLSNVPTFPRLSALSWRLDVTIANSTLSRVLEPHIELTLTLDDGEVRKFGVNQTKFQQLRFAVASMLRQMESLENRSIFKLQETR